MSVRELEKRGIEWSTAAHKSQQKLSKAAEDHQKELAAVDEKVRRLLDSRDQEIVRLRRLVAESDGRRNEAEMLLQQISRDVSSVSLTGFDKKYNAPVLSRNID